MGKREIKRQHKFIRYVGPLLVLVLAAGALSMLPGRPAEEAGLPAVEALATVPVAQEPETDAPESSAEEEAEETPPVQTRPLVDMREPLPEPEEEKPAPPDPEKPLLALTFDDGPCEYTDSLLDILAEHGAKATFFLVGRMIGKNADAARRAAEEGHELGSHSWSHAQLTKLSDAAIAEELDKANAKILEAAGVEPTLLRPPYGAHNKRVRALAAERGMALVNWSIDPQDWRNRNADTVYQWVMDRAADGAIVLCHDIHPTTIEAMERLVPDLMAQGYQLVTVTELLTLRGGEIEPGRMYLKLPAA